MKRPISWALSGVMAGLLAVAGVGGVSAQDRESWLKAAQLGPQAPAKQDWAAIEAAARKEGSVVIYSVSSRIFDLAETFEIAAETLEIGIHHRVRPIGGDDAPAPPRLADRRMGGEPVERAFGGGDQSDGGHCFADGRSRSASHQGGHYL